MELLRTKWSGNGGNFKEQINAPFGDEGITGSAFFSSIHATSLAGTENAVKVLESTKELTKFMVSTGSTTLRPSYLAGRSLQGHVSAAVQEDWQVDSKKHTVEKAYLF